MKSISQSTKVILPIVLALLLLTTIVAFTPQGRGLAKEVLNFFIRSEKDELPLPAELQSEQIPPIYSSNSQDSTETELPTDALNYNERLGFYTDATPTAISRETKGGIDYGLTFSEAEVLAAFPVIVPNSLPDGYKLQDIAYNHTTQTVIQYYLFVPVQAGEMFFLSQERLLPSDAVGSNASVQQISIGDITIEYVQGSWEIANGSSSQDWHSDSNVHNLRWTDGEYFYKLQFIINETFSPAYLTKEEMLAIAESIISASGNK